jgi:hypothetical protein
LYDTISLVSHLTAKNNIGETFLLSFDRELSQMSLYIAGGKVSIYDGLISGSACSRPLAFSETNIGQFLSSSWITVNVLELINVNKTEQSMENRRRYILAALIVTILLVAVSVAIGYVIGRAVRRNESASVAKSAKMIAEKNRELHKAAVDQVSPSNLRDNLR